MNEQTSASTGKQPPTPPRPSSPVTFESDLQRFFNFICKINPFYLLSACLLLYSQKVVFDINVANIWIDTSIPLSIMLFYTLLLSATAIFIVRMGKVWDDARSIIMICLILFMAVSVGLDGILMEEPRHGQLLTGATYLFSLMLLEILCRYLPIKLRFNFRLVFYTILGYFFFYPIWLSYIILNELNTLNIPAIFLFPVFGGLLYLLLIPIIHKGKSYFSSNTTPWQWPFFPWFLFVLMGAGICIRTYFLSLSYYAGKGVGSFGNLESGFGLYMLIPFLLPVLILFMEHFHCTRNKLYQQFGLAAPGIFILLALPSIAFRSQLFHTFAQSLGFGSSSPIYIALLAAGLFYLYALLRKVNYSSIALAITLFTLCLVDSRLGKLANFHIPSLVPWLTLSTLLLLMGFVYKKSYWLATGWICFITTLACALKNTAFMDYHGAMPFHLGLAGLIVIGLTMKDFFAKVCQVISGLILPLLPLLVLFMPQLMTYPAVLRYFYIAVIIGTITVMYAVTRNKLFLGSLITSLLVLAASFFRFTYQQVAAFEIKGIKTIIWASACFITAFVISLHKGKILRRFLHIRPQQPHINQR